MNIGASIQKAKTMTSEFRTYAAKTLRRVKQQISNAASNFKAALPQVMANRKSFCGLKSDVRAMDSSTKAALWFVFGATGSVLGLADRLQAGDAAGAAFYGAGLGFCVSGLGIAGALKYTNG